MEIIKQYIKDFSEDRFDISLNQKQRDFEEKMQGLRPDINNLLHQYLPGDITIDEVEILAMAINDVIWHPRKYLPQGAAKPPSL